MAIIAVRPGPRAEAAPPPAAAAPPRRRRRRRPRRPPPPPAAGAASAEDHAGVEGAVRLRQGRAEARRQGRDRHRDHRASSTQVQKLELVLVTGHTDRDRHAAVQPEAVRAPRRRRPRLPGQQGRAERQDRNARHGQDAAGSGRGLHADEHEGADRLSRAEPPRRSRSQGRSRQAANASRSRTKKPRLGGAFFSRARNRVGTSARRLSVMATRRAKRRSAHRRALDRAGRAGRRARPATRSIVDGGDASSRVVPAADAPTRVRAARSASTLAAHVLHARASSTRTRTRR